MKNLMFLDVTYRKGVAMSGFKSKVLTLPEKDLPPSIPLLIPKSYEWNMEKNCLSKRETRAEENMHLADEALQLIRSVDKPIAVLSICGLFRSGKSYLLSRILGGFSVFTSRSTVNPCTKGVWMSTTVLECDKFVVLLLDTEGMDSTESTEEGEDTMCMAQLQAVLLISSLLIYNGKQTPECNDLDNLG